MTVRHATLLLLASTLCVVAAVAGLLMRGGDEPSPQPERRQFYERALAKAYVDAQCWQCHTVSTLAAELAGDFGAQAAGARTAGPDLAGIGGLYPDGWHAAHLFNPQSVQPGSKMPAQRQLFVLEGAALTPNLRGEKRPSLKFATQQLIVFLQTLTEPSEQRPNWPRGRHALPERGSVNEGKTLFARLCAGCHGQAADGRGDAAMFFSKPPANLAAGKFTWRGTRAPVPSYDDLYSTLTNGLPGSGMPSFSHLSSHERASLVAFVAALNRESYDAYEAQFTSMLPQVALDDALVEQGRELYASERYQCAACHGEKGRGDGPQANDLIRKYNTPPRDLGLERFRRGGQDGIFATIALGLGEPMPGVLKDDGTNLDDVRALAAYARALNRFEK